MKHELKMLPPQDNFRTVRILEQLARTNRALAELKGYARTIPNQHILINAITINEAKDSSEIENIVTTHDEIYKAMTQSNYKNESAKEVVDYRSAIWRGYNLVKEKEIITTNILVEIQSIIEHNNAGIRKIPGTVLKNLEEYINTDDMIDPLIKLAIIHYQFESIHPFYDGNGRTGRILNILYLVLKDLLDSPILYLSRYINDNKQTYYKLFKEVRETNNFEEWIIYILIGIEETAKETMKLIKDIQSEMESYGAELKEKLPKIYSKELLEGLFFEVYTKINYMENICGVTRKTAMSYLSQLEEAGFLSSEKIGRDRIYKNDRLINLLKNK